MNGAMEQAGLDALSPWDFPSLSLQLQRLERAGFTVVSLSLFARPTPLPTGISGWLRTFAGPFVGALPGDVQAQILADAERRLTALCDSVEGWVADYVRLRFFAQKRD